MTVSNGVAPASAPTTTNAGIPVASDEHSLTQRGRPAGSCCRTTT